MRLTTWNVNGIRNPFGYQPWNSARTFTAMFDILEADIVVMQELKIQRKDLRDDMVLIDGWDCYFSLPKHKKGYSGVGIYTRNSTCSPIRAEEGLLGVLTPPNSVTAYRDLPESQHIGGYPSEFQVAELGVDPTLLDSEGRCVCLEFPAFVLFGVYSPANSNGLRDDFRIGFLSALDCRIRNLTRMGKRVVLVGDLNVSRGEADTAGAIEELRKTGVSHEDYISSPNRRIFNQLLVGGEVFGERDEGREHPILMDVVRDFHPDRKGMYTHWEQKVNARPGNFGSRIDFVLASSKMNGWFSEADIQEGLMGSDHCPVYGVFKDIVEVREEGASREVHLLDIMSPLDVFKDSVRQKEWNVKDLPPNSAKLMPEFYQRRSIKDMFKKPSTTSSTGSVAVSSMTPASSLETLTSLNSNSSSAISVNGGATSTPSVASRSPDTKRKASDASVPKQVKRQKSMTITSGKAPPARGQQSLKGFFQPKSIPKLATQVKHVKSQSTDAIGRGAAPVSSQGSLDHGAVTTMQPGQSPAQAFSTAPNKKTPMYAHEGSECDIAMEEETEDDELSTPGAKDTTNSTVSPSRHVDTANFYSASTSRTPTKPEPPPPPSSTTSPITVDDDNDLVHDPIVSKESWDTLFRKPAAPLCESHEEPCKSMLTKKKGENQGRSFWMCARPLGPSGQKEKATQWRCGTFIWCSDWKGDG